MENLTDYQQQLINSWNIDEETKEFFIKLYEDDNRLVEEIKKRN